MLYQLCSVLESSRKLARCFTGRSQLHGLPELGHSAVRGALRAVVELCSTCLGHIRLCPPLTSPCKLGLCATDKTRQFLW